MTPRSPLHRAILAIVFLAAGCAAPESETPARAEVEPRPGGALRLAHQLPLHVDPALTDDAYEATVVNQIYDGLVTWDGDLNLRPEIATAWTISRDGLVYTFELRDDARFHNGRPVRAEDFVYSFTRLLRVPPGIIQDYLVKIDGVRPFLAGEADTVAGLEAVDSLTVRITLDEPYPSFLSVLCMDQAKVVPREEVERDDRPFGSHPVGSGPFRLASWEPGRRMVLEAFPDYHGHRAYLDSLVFLEYPDSLLTRIADDFFAGELDVRELRDADLAELRSRGEYRLVRRPELSLEMLAFNVERPPFDDERVRRAISMALDRRAFREVAGADFQDPSGLLPPGMPAYSPESKLWPEDVEAARSLVESLGHGPGDPLRFVLYTASRSRYAMRRDSVFVASLARAWIEPELRYVDWAELDRRLTELDADSFFIIWIADLPDPDSFLYTLFSGEGLYNMFAYADPVVDSLLAAGQKDRDMGQRQRLYRQAEERILRDAPCVPLFNFMATFAFQPEVHGVEMTPFGLSGIPMHRIWLDREPATEVRHAGL